MAYCTHCGAPRQSGSPFCTRCGDQINSGSSTSTISAPLSSPAANLLARRRRPSRLAIVLIPLVLFVGGGLAVWALMTRDADPPATPNVPVGPPQAAVSSSVQSGSFPAPQRIATASASCVSAPSMDAGSTRFTYEPGKAIDGLSDTAWRCDGDGVGQRLEISFPSRTTLVGIGMIPGYAKTDPVDGTDRYAQNRRIAAVEYTFDDGSTISQNFDTSTSNRAIQMIALSGLSTEHVTITIHGSVPGEDIGGRQAFDKVAISEVVVSTG